MTRMQTTSNDQDHQGRIAPPPRARFSIYENKAYVQDRCYLQNRISIGRSPKADLILNHQSIEDIHAWVHFEGDKAYLTNKFPENGLQLNGRSVELETLHHEDVIDIGPFLLKFKLIEREIKRSQDKEETYCICLANAYKSAEDIQQAAAHLAGMLRVDAGNILPFLKKSHYVIKKKLAIMEATRWQNALHKAGVLCDIQLEREISRAKVPPDRQRIDPDTEKTASAKVKVKETWRPAPMVTTNTDIKPPVGKAEQRKCQRHSNKKSEKKTSHLKKRTLVQDLGGAGFQTGGIRADVEDLKPGSNKDIGPKDFLEMDCRISERKQWQFKDAPITIDNLRQAPWVMVSAEMNSDDTQKPASDEQIVKVIDEPFIDEDIQRTARENVFKMREKPVRPHWPEGFLTEDEPVEDEEIWQAPFSIAEELKPLPAPGREQDPASIRLRIIKTIGERIWETEYLSKGGKYDIVDETGHFCLVHFRSVEPTIYITSQFEGVIKNQHNEVIDNLDSYKCEAYCFSRKNLVYDVPVPDKGAVVIDWAGSQYTISKTCLPPSPIVDIKVHSRLRGWRHWAISTGVHVVLCLCLFIYTYSQAVGLEELEPRFATVDPEMLKRIEPVTTPLFVKSDLQQKGKSHEAVDQVGSHIAKKPPENEQPRPLKVSQKTETRSKVAKTTKASKYRRAGGGYEKEKIKKRNINQTGLLSALSTVSAGACPGNITADISQDAAPLSGNAENNFTVDGLKGALGNEKISVVTGEIVRTRGAEQVLRGAETRRNSTEIAALERGTTGMKQVQATVSAKMNPTVRIEGGMSREMVKQVIDQHLEEITHCYETALTSNPSISGRIVFEWKILMNGRVGQIGIVASNVNSHEIHDCIKTAIKTWQFPKPVGAEVIISYPFIFDLVAF